MKSDKYILISRLALIVAIIILTIITAIASLDYGVAGILHQALSNSASMQVLIDLAISLCIILVWMYFDAKKHNRKFFVWVIITFLIGVYGPLFYLLIRKKSQY